MAAEITFPLTCTQKLERYIALVEIWYICYVDGSVILVRNIYYIETENLSILCYVKKHMIVVFRA